MDLDRIRFTVHNHGVDALVALGPENVQALTGCFLPMHRLIPERWVAACIGDTGTPVIIASAFDATSIDVEGWQIQPHHGTERSAVDVLRTWLGQRKGALDLASCTAAQAEAVGIKDDASPLLRELRAVKEPEEIAALRIAARATREAELRTISEPVTGVTEAELAQRLRTELAKGGAEATAFVVLGGRRTALVSHPRPSAQDRFTRGDVIRIDAGGWFGGWVSDLGLTVAAGAAPDESARAYSAVHTALTHLIEACHPGADAGDLFRSVERELALSGLSLAAPHVGHGIGLGVHDAPTLSAASHDRLAAGHVVCVEIVVVQEPFRLHLEETVVVTSSGPDLLSDPPIVAPIPIIVR